MAISTLPINPSLLGYLRALRALFQSEFPLPGFVVIPDFLTAEALSNALEGCHSAEYATFCGYSPTGDPRDIRAEFCEPREDYTYATIHERPVSEIPQLTRLYEAFATAETRRVLAEMTGIELREIGFPSVLTCWGPWSFLEPHTDAGTPSRPTRLVVSLSLTERWDPRHGGATTFWWTGSPRSVTIQPQLNTAVLFAPHPGSFHWVEQIAGDAPPRSRFTWVLPYL